MPGPGLRRAWDARAWADGRPDKVIPEPGADLNGRWLRELADLGYVDRDKPVDLPPRSVAKLDRDQAVTVVLARLGTARSGWNAADIRGEVEQLLARQGIVIDAAVRGELAEDLTARALTRCVPLLGRDGVPEHIRALSSRPVLDVEEDIVGRLAARGAQPGRDVAPELIARVAKLAGRSLDAGQTRAVTVLAGDRPLVVVEGAAGAGETTTLAATRAVLALQGHSLIVVTPTLQAAQAARAEVGAQAGSAAWLAYQHGWRWDQHGAWTRLAVDDIDPVTDRDYTGPGDKAQLRAGDLLLVDEAGMVDPDTARALLVIADEHGARVAFVGDRHQLPAVGRGGVLDLTHRRANPNARVSLNVVHRFTRPITDEHGCTRTVPDNEYAVLTAVMRVGTDPGAVFDTLHARGQIRLHPNESEQCQAIADDVLAARRAGTPVTVIADTREQVAQLNATIRDQLICAGLVDHRPVVTTRSGERIGVGDLVATRRNDRDLQVANRDTWAVTGIDPTDGVWVTKGDARNLVSDERPHRAQLLPAEYVDRYVELAYASTVHGAQGHTTTTAHLVLDEHTGAASAYVGMTRGREQNTAHLIADSVDEAREQWIAAFARDRADLGPAHARQLAAAEAARYAQPRPLPQVLAELHQAWEAEARCAERLERAVPLRNRLAEVIALRREQDAHLAPAAERYEQANQADAAAKARVEDSEAIIADQTNKIHDRLTAEWNAQLDSARQQARVALAGPGRLGLKLVAVNRATDQLAAWSMSWQPILPEMPTSTASIAYHDNRYLDEPRLHDAFERYARAQAEHAHPEHGGLLAAVEQTGREREHARDAWYDRDTAQRRQLGRYGRLAYLDNPGGQLDELDHDITRLRDEQGAARERIGQLAAEPAITSRPPEFLTTERGSWQRNRDEQREATQRTAAIRAARATEADAHERLLHAEQHTPHHAPEHDHGPSIGF